MSTRSYIAIANNDGTFLGIYCHSDGYIEQPGVGWHLMNFYNDEAKARELIGLGDCSSIFARVKPRDGEGHGFGYAERAREDGGVTVAYHRDRGEDWDDVKPGHSIALPELLKTAKSCGADFAYLFTGGKWRAWQPYRGGVASIDDMRELDESLIDASLKVEPEAQG